MSNSGSSVQIPLDTPITLRRALVKMQEEIRELKATVAELEAKIKGN